MEYSSFSRPHYWPASFFHLTGTPKRLRTRLSLIVLLVFTSGISQTFMQRDGCCAIAVAAARCLAMWIATAVGLLGNVYKAVIDVYRSRWLLSRTVLYICILEWKIYTV